MATSSLFFSESIEYSTPTDTWRVGLPMGWIVGVMTMSSDFSRKHRIFDGKCVKGSIKSVGWVVAEGVGYLTKASEHCQKSDA